MLRRRNALANRCCILVFRAPVQARPLGSTPARAHQWQRAPQTKQDWSESRWSLGWASAVDAQTPFSSRSRLWHSACAPRGRPERRCRRSTPLALLVQESPSDKTPLLGQSGGMHGAPLVGRRRVTSGGRSRGHAVARVRSARGHPRNNAPHPRGRGTGARSAKSQPSVTCGASSAQRLRRRPPAACWPQLQQTGANARGTSP